MERLAVNPRTCSAWLGYLDSIMGVCQTIDLSTRTFLSESKVPIWLSEPAELAGRVMSGELPPPSCSTSTLCISFIKYPFRQVAGPSGSLKPKIVHKGLIKGEMLICRC